MSDKEIDKGEMEDYVDVLSRQRRSHSDWLKMMRFGMAYLLDNQQFMLRLIEREARKQAGENGGSDPLNAYVRIIGELGLRFEVTS